MKDQKTTADNLISAISKVINLINLGWWKEVIQQKPHPDTNPNISDLKEALLEAAKSITEYESHNSGKHIKTSIWHDPERTGKVLLDICNQQKFKLPEDAVLWVLENYERRPFTWEFNHCNQPKFWFGDRVAFKSRKGTIYTLEWRDEISQGLLQKGWWYRIRWDGRLSLEGIHEDSLTSIPRKDQLLST